MFFNALTLTVFFVVELCVLFALVDAFLNAWISPLRSEILIHPQPCLPTPPILLMF